MNKHIFLLIKLSLVFLLSISSNSQAEHNHVHGESQMTVILDKENIIITLSIAAHDLVGFENEPNTVEQQSSLNNAITQLKATDQWLNIVNGSCIKVGEKIYNPFTENNSNLDFEFSSTFTCQSLRDVKEIVVSIHQQFNRITETEVQWITDDKQGLIKINRHQDTISFK